MVRRKYKERVTQKFIRTSSESIEMPPIAEDLRELCRPNKISTIAFKGIEPDRNDGICGLDEDGLGAQMSVLASFPGIDGSQEQGSICPVDIEIQEATVGQDVLLGEITQ